MGANRVTIGNRGALPLFSFTAANQDSGPLMFDASQGYSQIRGCSDFTLGLIGNGSGLQVKLYFTTDIATAQGTANNWYLVTAPSTEANAQWSNPLQNNEGQNVCYFKAHAIALRAVSSTVAGQTPSGTTTLTLMAGY